MNILTTAAELSRRNQGLVVRGDLLRAGISGGMLARALADRRLLRVRRQVYALAPLPPLPRFVVTDTGVSHGYAAHVRAILLSLGPAAAACGRTAAALRGWGMLVEPGRTVEVAVPHGRSGVELPLVRAVQRRRLAGELYVVLPGTAALRITDACQTALDCALSRPQLEAVVLIDSALRSGQVSIEELQRAAERLPGVREASRCRRALELCAPASGSVLESVLRVLMLRSGISGVESQVVIRNGPGQHLRVDFCFRTAGLIVEVDGQRWHPDPHRDRHRDNVLASLGWRVLRYTWSEVMHEQDRVLAEIRTALECGRPGFQLRADLSAHAA